VPLVTGVGGAVGRRVAALVAAAGHPLRVMTRDAARAPALAGVEVAVGDYAAPDTLPAVFDGIETAFLVSGYAREGERAALHG
jgi:NAD(P)H dehydrogenase (quinone)